MIVPPFPHLGVGLLWVPSGCVASLPSIFLRCEWAAGTLSDSSALLEPSWGAIRFGCPQWTIKQTHYTSHRSENVHFLCPIRGSIKFLNLTAQLPLPVFLDCKMCGGGFLMNGYNTELMGYIQFSRSHFVQIGNVMEFQGR